MSPGVFLTLTNGGLTTEFFLTIPASGKVRSTTTGFALLLSVSFSPTVRRGRLDGGGTLEISEAFRETSFDKSFRIRGGLNGLKGMVGTNGNAPYG
jgi:hypothetical protein